VKIGRRRGDWGGSGPSDFSLLRRGNLVCEGPGEWKSSGRRGSKLNQQKRQTSPLLILLNAYGLGEGDRGHPGHRGALPTPESCKNSDKFSIHLNYPYRKCDRVMWGQPKTSYIGSRKHQRVKCWGPTDLGTPKHMDSGRWHCSDEVRRWE